MRRDADRRSNVRGSRNGSQPHGSRHARRDVLGAPWPNGFGRPPHRRPTGLVGVPCALPGRRGPCERWAHRSGQPGYRGHPGSVCGPDRRSDTDTSDASTLSPVHGSQPTGPLDGIAIRLRWPTDVRTYRSGVNPAGSRSRSARRKVQQPIPGRHAPPPRTRGPQQLCCVGSRGPPTDVLGRSRDRLARRR